MPLDSRTPRPDNQGPTAAPTTRFSIQDGTRNANDSREPDLTDAPGLPSLLRHYDMSSILQWALNVAEERVRSQQATAQGSTSQALPSRPRQDPVVEDGPTPNRAPPHRHHHAQAVGRKGETSRTRNEKPLRPASDVDSIELEAEALQATAIVTKGKSRVSISSPQQVTTHSLLLVAQKDRVGRLFGPSASDG